MSSAPEPTYILVIRATDQGQDVQFSANITVRVLIQRVNEFAPMFTDPGVSITLKEDKAIGTVIHTVS